MARIAGPMPTEEQINEACADALRAYKQYKRKRILIFVGFALATAILIALFDFAGDGST